MRGYFGHHACRHTHITTPTVLAKQQTHTHTHTQYFMKPHHNALTSPNQKLYTDLMSFRIGNQIALWVLNAKRKVRNCAWLSHPNGDVFMHIFHIPNLQSTRIRRTEMRNGAERTRRSHRTRSRMMRSLVGVVLVVITIDVFLAFRHVRAKSYA